MTIHYQSHPVSFKRPYYSTSGGAQLHRYLDPDFVNKFQRELSLQRFDQAWLNEDRFSDHGNEPVLRLPMHHSFYLISTEVICDHIGFPALDPKRITSAGFVIRKLSATLSPTLSPTGEKSWLLEEGEAMGWQDSPTGLNDPDIHRRVCRENILHPRLAIEAYSGEQTHPLHVKTTTDDNKKTRTILYGYVPLGGTYRLPSSSTASPFDSSSENNFRTVAKQQLPWPFGYRKNTVPGNHKKNQELQWQKQYNTPIKAGIPDAASFELLRVLINRYHLGESNVTMNQRLQQVTEAIFFAEKTKKHNKTGLTDKSLWDYLSSFSTQGEKNRLVEWLIRQEDRIEASGSIDVVNQFEQLPGWNGQQHLDDSLYLSPSDAQNLRDALDQRLFEHASNKAKEIPLPKFQQGEHDRYQIVPFIRARDKEGKERIYWADASARSESFRVAAPFDPLASRPSVIQMPSLKDLRKGMAQGVSMITPADTFSLLNALKLKKGVSEEVLPDNEPVSLGIQWICSFSLPVVTLIAMILLMIMISLLNIVFFWLPWVRICIPFPKIK